MNLRGFMFGGSFWREKLLDVPRVSIVSAFGRGQWLASELRSLHMDVTVLDVTDSLGRWAPEDVEGPFGYFQPEALLPTQRARLEAEDYADLVEDGFSIWLKSGPVDFRGTHSRYLLQKREVPTAVVDYIEKFPSLAHKERRARQEEFVYLGFAQNWPAQLAHALTNPVWVGNVHNIRSRHGVGQPAPLFAPYFLRRVSRRGVEKSWAWVKSSGAEVIEKASLGEFRTEGAWLKRVEFRQAGESKIENLRERDADIWVWMLTSGETTRHSKKAFATLFNGEVLNPEAVWMRYRLEVNDAAVTSILPQQFLLIEELALPWSHSHFQQVIKTSTADQFDIWVRVPALHRFEKTYLEKLGAEIAEKWRERIPGVEVRLVDLPPEHKSSLEELGPARHGMYAAEALEDLKRQNLANVHFDGPELWPTLDWTGQFQAQHEIFNRIRSWKVEYDVQLAKQKAREAKRAKREGGGEL